MVPWTKLPSPLVNACIRFPNKCGQASGQSQYAMAEIGYAWKYIVEICINLQVLRKTYRCTNVIKRLWTYYCFFLMEQEIFLTFKSTLRVRSLQIYICTPQCHFLSWTCSLSVTNSITGNSWRNPVKTVTHKKVLLELEFSPWPWGSTFHAKLIMRDAKNNLSQ